MVCMGLTVRLQRHTNFSDTLRPMGGKCLKSIFTYLDWTKYNEIDIFISMYKTTLPIQNSINCINILYTGSYKSIPI